MTLGTFTPRTRITGDKIDLRQQQWYGRPMLMRCNEYSDSFNSTLNNKVVEAVWADVVDLASGTILINVLFTSGAIVDNLKEHAGTELVLPVKIAKQAGGKFGGYAILEALTEQEQAAAGQWHQQYWGLVEQERAKREAAARPLQSAAPQGQPFGAPQQGFAPTAQAPEQGFGAPVQGQAGQFGAPVQGQAGQFGAPAQQPAQGGYGQPTQGFGQVAQGGAPAQQLPHDQGQFAQSAPQQGQWPAQSNPQAVALGLDPAHSPQYPGGQAPAQQFQQGQAPAFGAPAQQAYPATPGAPQGQFNQPAAGQAPGMFTDAPPPADPNQGFQAPNAQNMLAQLNNQLG